MRCVELRFTPKGAGLILRARGHPQQVVAELRDGGLTMELRVAHSPEREAAVRWAGDVEVGTPGRSRERKGEPGRGARKHAC